jgi:hypothetical protein
MINTTVSEFIGHFIALVTRVPFDPAPFYLVTQSGLVECLPQIDIFYGRFARGLPTFRFPTR